MSGKSLVCRKCRYKQSDDMTVAEFEKKFPGLAAHDIPYYYGACADNANDAEFEHMMRETRCED